MVGAVGIGHVVGARSGPALHPMICEYETIKSVKKKIPTVFMCQVAMNLSWAILGFLTCATPKAWDLGSATLLMTSINHALFSVVFYLKDPSVLRNLKKST
jgi:hypothetical protein